ncbi:hypothetical protein ATI61_103508 [Archangium gephyra]|uniref:Trypsin domain protein n=1 Tax=Archangium gephyra TaxID=48 RepID=A0AAC8Q7B4_9BACT|nr:zinc dependent phospholipase C family protein [Archangium gephyra]AKJ01793.1 trypsin domain protein [Archangium gephyra]REG34602.1 hypothetical protein ATI61_103508 [Archangium gephyra]
MNRSLSSMPTFRSSLARAPLAACLFLAVLGFALPAQAWKPITHVYLAEKARAEMLSQNGSVSLHQTDFWNRAQMGLIGTYPVSSPIHQALRDYPAYFRAGVLGPDAYPDMLFGQSVIHPDTGEHGSDSDPWLRHLYARASTPQQRAFVMGFLSHAAGDMFAHTFVNHYAGGPFAFANDNAKRHIVTEGHIANRTPYLGDLSYADWTRYTIDTSAVNTFIHDNMIDARRSRDGTWSNDVWKLTRNTRAYSPARLFAELRAGLEDKIEAYYAHVRWLRDQIRYHEDRCNWRPWTWGHCAQAGYYRTVLFGYKFVAGLAIQYVEAWVQDINRGLRAWPETSTEVARNLFMQLNHKANVPGAKTALLNYKSQYLCSMMGAPDAFCTLSNLVESLIDAITFKIDLFRELKLRLLDYVVEKATDHDTAYWAAIFDPDSNMVNQEVPSNPSGTASSTQMDQLMFISGSPARFDMMRFAPAYNTYAATKMSFVDNPQHWSSVINTLGWWTADLPLKMSEFDAPRGFNGQVMLGFIRSMDQDNQWATPKRMFIAQNPTLFMNLFMQQTGDVFDPTNNTILQAERLTEKNAWIHGANKHLYSTFNTNNATTGTSERKIFLRPGETLTLGTCGVPGASSGSNTYLRLFAPGGVEVAANDNACGGLQSQFTYTVPSGALADDYTLRAGCAGNGACGGTVAWTISGSYTYSASNTNNANYNYTPRGLRLVEGQRLQLGTCGVPGAWGNGDTYLRLYTNAGIQMTYNDDSCGWLSKIHYVVPWETSGDHQVRSGCFNNTSCSGTVSYVLSAAYTD